MCACVFNSLSAPWHTQPLSACWPIPCLWASPIGCSKRRTNNRTDEALLIRFIDRGRRTCLKKFTVRWSHRCWLDCNTAWPASDRLHLRALPRPSAWTKPHSLNCLMWHDINCRDVASFSRNSPVLIPKVPVSDKISRNTCCIPATGCSNFDKSLESVPLDYNDALNHTLPVGMYDFLSFNTNQRGHELVWRIKTHREWVDEGEG